MGAACDLCQLDGYKTWRLERTWTGEDDIKMDPKETWCEGLDWVDVTQNRNSVEWNDVRVPTAISAFCLNLLSIFADLTCEKYRQSQNVFLACIFIHGVQTAHKNKPSHPARCSEDQIKLLVK